MVDEDEGSPGRFDRLDVPLRSSSCGCELLAVVVSSVLAQGKQPSVRTKSCACMGTEAAAQAEASRARSFCPSVSTLVGSPRLAVFSNPPRSSRERQAMLEAGSRLHTLGCERHAESVESRTGDLGRSTASYARCSSGPAEGRV